MPVDEVPPLIAGAVSEADGRVTVTKLNIKGEPCGSPLFMQLLIYFPLADET